MAVFLLLSNVIYCECIFHSIPISRGCDTSLPAVRFKRWENFLLQSQLCALTLIWSLFNPGVTAVACKRPWSLCQSAGGSLHLNKWLVSWCFEPSQPQRITSGPKQAYTSDPTKPVWADYVTVQA